MPERVPPAFRAAFSTAATAATAAIAAALPALAALFAISGLIACDAKLAGGGSGIENPGLALAFKGKDGGPEPISGRLRLFRENSDWQDTGFYSRTLENQDTVLISSRDLQSLAEPIAPDGLAPDSSFGFNVIVSSADGGEGMLRGFRLRGSAARGYAFASASTPGKAGEIVDFLMTQSVRLFSGTLPEGEAQ